MDPVAPRAPQAANHQHLPVAGGEPPGPPATPDDDGGVVAHREPTHRRAPHIKVSGVSGLGSRTYFVALTMVAFTTRGARANALSKHAWPRALSFPAR